MSSVYTYNNKYNLFTTIIILRKTYIKHIVKIIFLHQTLNVL